MVVTTYSKIGKHNLKAFITSVSFKTACLYERWKQTYFLAWYPFFGLQRTVLLIYVTQCRCMSALLKEENNKEPRIWTGIEHLKNIFIEKRK